MWFKLKELTNSRHLIEEVAYDKQVLKMYYDFENFLLDLPIGMLLSS